MGETGLGGRSLRTSRRGRFLLAGVLTAAALSTAAVGPTVPHADAATCEYPAQVLNLADWKLQLPLAQDAQRIVEVAQPELATYSTAPFFVVADPGGCGGGVRFQAPVNGAHTSGSHYARSELREMTDSGRSDASWSSTSGTHTFTETVAFTAVPSGKPDVVGAQIHNATEDISLLVLRGTKLYVTDSGADTAQLVTGSYQLGTRIEMKWVVSGGTTQAFVNGAPQLSFDRAYSGAYFKAGAYPQASCDNASPCTSDNHGATIITQLAVSHTAGSVTPSAAGPRSDMTEPAPNLSFPTP